MALAESRVAGLGLAITAIGIGVTGLAPGYTALIAITVFWSVGFHLWASVSSATAVKSSTLLPHSALRAFRPVQPQPDG